MVCVTSTSFSSAFLRAMIFGRDGLLESTSLGSPDWHVSMVDIHLRKLLWVYCPGHAGVKGNDRADRLAALYKWWWLWRWQNSDPSDCMYWPTKFTHWQLMSDLLTQTLHTSHRSHTLTLTHVTDLAKRPHGGTLSGSRAQVHPCAALLKFVHDGSGTDYTLVCLIACTVLTKN